MTCIHLQEGMPLSHYLAEEQRIAQEGDTDVMFTWVSPPTVIYGRHQVVENEVNLPYCQQHGIEVVQRQSGGGCVYSDGGNVMVSYIRRSEHTQEVFAEYLKKLVGALSELGLNAVSTTHNDVLVGERKVSGNACQLCGHSTIVHGTLAVDIDMERLTKAITPPPEKLQKHGVESVRQRVANLIEFGIDDVEKVRRHIEEYMTR